MKYILAIDIGTTAFKAAVIDRNGTVLSSAAVEYTAITPHSGWVEMEVDTYTDTFRKATSAAIKEAGILAADILTIGMSSQGETTIFLDREGRPLRRAIVWFDTRAEKGAQQIVDHFGSKVIQEHTGQVGVDAIWPGAKILFRRRFGNFNAEERTVLFGTALSLIESTLIDRGNVMIRFDDAVWPSRKGNAAFARYKRRFLRQKRDRLNGRLNLRRDKRDAGVRIASHALGARILKSARLGVKNFDRNSGISRRIVDSRKETRRHDGKNLVVF